MGSWLLLLLLLFWKISVVVVAAMLIVCVAVVMMEGLGGLLGVVRAIGRRMQKREGGGGFEGMHLVFFLVSVVFLFS